MPRLRSWEAMDPRAAGVNDRLGAKDQLCAPQVFTFGHVRQFEKVIGDSLGAAWDLGAGPGSHRLVVDIDSTIREVFGKLKGPPATGTPRSSAITRSSPPGPTPARSSMPG